jgi:IstB-like ATP binding protein
MSRFRRRGAELLFEVFSQRYERGSTIVTSNLPFEEWTSVFGAQRLTGALLDRLIHHVHILSMNGESCRLIQSTRRRKPARAAAEDRRDHPHIGPGKIFAAGMKRGPHLLPHAGRKSLRR